jgi:hypothetical protein
MLTSAPAVLTCNCVVMCGGTLHMVGATPSPDGVTLSAGPVEPLRRCLRGNGASA